nr:hypothetical protein [Tanacetum cinerariifolium]
MFVAEKLNDIISIDSLEAAQKCKVRWAIEGTFPPGFNSTFIALILKIHDAKVVKDYCPISLIGSLYKIIANILANRLSFVISDGALNSPSSLSKCTPWLDIIRGVTVLHTKCINILDLIRKKAGNGLNTLFWEDPWLDDLALEHKFSRIYALDNYKQITVVEKINHTFMVDTFRRPLRGSDEEEQLGFLLSHMDGLILTNIVDRWVLLLESTCEFSIKSVCQLIDDSILPTEEVVTRWVKVMPIKINVFSWRVSLDKLSTLLNRSLKGIDISTNVCPLCHVSVEFGSHIFFLSNGSSFMEKTYALVGAQEH